MSETYMVMVLVPIMAPFTCIGAGETRATQIWARVTTRAAVGNCKRQILLQSISARSVPEGSDGGPAARAGPHPPVSRRQTAGDRDQSGDRKSTRLNSSHPSISYAVFCLKKKMI